MSSAVLKENVAKFIKAKRLSFYEFEKEAGLHKNYISNFLAGKSNPNLEVLMKMANSLNVSINDLVYETPNFSKTITFSFDKIELDESLLNNCQKEIQSALNAKKYEMSFNKYMMILKETYLYCLHRNQKKLDKKFIHWFVEHVDEQN